MKKLLIIAVLLFPCIVLAQGFRDGGSCSPDQSNTVRCRNFVDGNILVDRYALEMCVNTNRGGDAHPDDWQWDTLDTFEEGDGYDGKDKANRPNCLEALRAYR